MSTTSQARQRIDSLLDENSFVEIGAQITARNTDFNMKQSKTPSDGVITGYGVIGGNLVFVYSQDASVMGGSVGEMHAKKVAALYSMAVKMGAPVIGLLDSTGLRLEESTDALNGFGTIFAKMTDASGVVPQITGVFGNCGGALSILTSMSDFTFMEKSSTLFINSPDAISGNSKDKCDTSACGFQSEEAGNVDFCGDEAAVLEEIRALVSLLPGNNEEEAYTECTDDLNRACTDLKECAADASLALSRISDNGVLLETRRDFAKEMVTGFIQLNGATVGAVANRTAVFDENGKEKETFDAALTHAGCEKAARFVRFCDAFSIPVLTLTNVNGFAATKCSEKRMSKAAAGLTAAFAKATVGKVNVITGEAFGSAYIVMNSKATGADITIAWPDAKIGTMDAGMAAKIICDGKSAEEMDECAKQYSDLQNNVQSAAKRGYIDQIVEPADTRKYVIGAFEMLATKCVTGPDKKHGTV